MNMKSIDIKSLINDILEIELVFVLMGQFGMNRQFDVNCVTDNAMVHTDPLIACRKFFLNSLVLERVGIHGGWIFSFKDIFKSN